MALACLGLLLAALLGSPRARADVLADVELLRQSGCGGIGPAASPLRPVERLSQLASGWASGRSLSQAARAARYLTQPLTGIHVKARGDTRLQALRQAGCLTLMNRQLSDVGIYQRGSDAWLILAPSGAAELAGAAPVHIPSALRRSSDAVRADNFALRVLALVNAARRRGAICGRRVFAPTQPVHLSTLLEQVAYGHALDMAEHDYFEHQDLNGGTPADRVRAAGYREKLVGENIAFGPMSAEEVVRGWLHSPGHCENIMDPRFAEMGLAAALGPAPQPASGLGLYWVQLLVDPTGRASAGSPERPGASPRAPTLR